MKFKERSTRGKPTREEFELLRGIVIAVFIGMAITIATMVIQAFKGDITTYHSLIDEINKQNNKIDLIYQQCTQNPYFYGK